MTTFKFTMRPAHLGLATLSAITFAALGGCASTPRDDASTSGAQAISPDMSTHVAAVDSIDGGATDVQEIALKGGIARREEVPNAIKTESGLSVPRGFKINVFAEGLDRPRRITFAPESTPQKYDVFVTEPWAGRVRVLRDLNGDGRADAKYTFVEGLSQPYGLAFQPGANWLYIGNTDAIVKVPYQSGATKASGAPRHVADLTEGGYNQHWTRNLLFSLDGEKLYATVGSSCNTCEEDDPQRAAISVMNPDGSNKRVFASGLRNPIGLAWKPNTNDLWTVVNERDNLGDNTPPDYLTLVRPGSFHGWPYAYSDINRGIHPDPEFGRGNANRVQQTVAPTVPVQAHSAALGLAWYPEPSLHIRHLEVKMPSQFPKEYAGDAFLAFHGSWNRSEKTGYKIVRVHFQNGRAVSVSDFVRGYLRNGEAWGRPVDIQVAPDGSLLFSDDTGGKIWRVSYSG